MNKKGFSLIEILVVIALVAAVGSASYVIMINSMKKSNQNKYDNMTKQIEEAADIYISLNSSLYNCVLNGTSIKVTLTTLKNAGYINDILINPLTNQAFENTCFVKATNNSNVIKYEFFCNNSDTTATSC